MKCLLKHYDVWEHNFISVPSWQSVFSFITHENMSEILLTARFCNESPKKSAGLCNKPKQNVILKKYDVDK